MAGYGDGRVYPRAGSKNLWIEYWFEGVQYRESTGADDEGLAKAYLSKRIAEKRAASVGLLTFHGPQRITLNQSTEDWYTHAAIFACGSAAMFSTAAVTAGS